MFVASLDLLRSWVGNLEPFRVYVYLYIHMHTHITILHTYYTKISSSTVLGLEHR